MKQWTLSIMLTLLAACQGPLTRGPDSAYYTYPTGMNIVLGRTLTVPANSATVRLQFGRTVASNAVQDTEPYCIFELNTVRDVPQPLAPERFDVIRIERRIQDFSGMPVAPMQGLFGRDEGPSQIYFITEFHLNAGKNGNVRSLSCQSNQSSLTPPQQRHLSLQEMQGAVGDYFSFEPPR
jgi:hypothetical protein